MSPRIPHIPLPSVMRASHQFAQVPGATIERSTFDMSHGHKTTFDAGYLIPVLLLEALPGDTFHLNMTAFARMTTPLRALMDNIYLDSFFFAVPYRLVWSHFQAFMGEQEPNTFTAYTLPVMSAASVDTGTLHDYLGVAPSTGSYPATAHSFVSLYSRAYNLVYNQWFRDENLIASATVDLGDGPDTLANYVLRRRGKRADYFTTCLPWPQKAAAAVALPLGTVAPVIPTSATAMPLFKGGTSAHVATKFTAAATANPSGTQVDDGGAGNWTAGENLYWSQVAGATGLQADLTNATAATINAIRQAFQIQKYYERVARGGSRYVEWVKAIFGVVSPDARLQRAEYLGGGSTPIVINPIAQTTPSGTVPGGGTSYQGALTGVGTVHATGHGFVKSFTEHTIVLGIVSVRADLTYQTGEHKMFQRSTPFDLYVPTFAHLGEQAVLQGEIYTLGTGADATVFGYQERYAEYRYQPSRISGLFRSYATGTLDSWHLSQKFVGAPTLGQTFIEENPPMDRVVAVTTEPKFYFDSYFQLKAARPMPLYGVPGFVDHF